MKCIKYSLCWQDKHLVSRFTFRVLHSDHHGLPQPFVEEDGPDVELVVVLQPRPS